MREKKKLIKMNPFPGLDKINLTVGEHKNRAGSLNIMEAAAWFAGEKHTSEPLAVCDVVASFVRRFSDDMLYEERNKLLRPMLPLICQTRKNGESPHVANRMRQKRLQILFEWVTGEMFSSWRDAAVESDAALGKRFKTMSAYYRGLNTRSFEFIRDLHEPVFNAKVGHDCLSVDSNKLSAFYVSGGVAACWAVAVKGGSYLSQHAMNVEARSYYFISTASIEAVRRVSEKLQKSAIELIKKICEIQ